MPTKLRSKMSVDERLATDIVALENAQNVQEIADLMAPFGYTSIKIGEGIAMHSDVEASVQKQIKEYGQQYAATEALNIARELAGKAYTKSLMIARIVFDHDIAAEQTLLLRGQRKHSYTGWIKQASTFYSALLNNVDYVARVAPYSLTTELLATENGLVKDVISKYETQLQEVGEAQSATKERDCAIDTFFGWMSSFYKFAKIACDGHPQLSEQLGIIDRS